MHLTNETYKAVMDFAYANYENGWDFVVECWGFEDVERVAKDAATLDDLLGRIYAKVATWKEFEDDIRNA